MQRYSTPIKIVNRFLFLAGGVKRLLGIDWAGVFLPKHRVGNGYTTELFRASGRGPENRRAAHFQNKFDVFS